MKARLPQIVCILTLGLFLASLIASIALLPDRVATHFDAAGRPNDWMNRTTHLLLMTLLGIVLPGTIIGCTALTRFLPISLINLPHRDYWLAPERREQTVADLYRSSFWMAALCLLFLTGIHLTVVAANRQQPVRLPTVPTLVLVGGFLLGTLLWIAGLIRRFHRPVGTSSGGLGATIILGIMLAGARTGWADEAPGDLPPRLQVEGQPLGANVRRVVEALQLLGTPLPDSVRQRLQPALEARDADAIQTILDPQVLLTVSINPESRVRVARGPVRAELQQFGFTPFLVKVLNESTVTRRLRPVSPQAGAVYAGVARGSLLRQQSVELIEDENTRRVRDRFLAVALYDEPPMVGRLSGLTVEYAIVLVLSTESGQRETTLGFDLGDQEQDLGARGETAVLWSVRPAIPVRIGVRDVDGTPTLGSLLIQDSHGRVYPPQPKRLAPDFFFQPQIYRADGESVLLPPGTFRVQSGRGPEYWVQQGTLTVRADGTADYRPDADQVNLSTRDHSESNGVRLQLKRWVDPERFGFYSGDHHIHAAGCAHYTSPTEGVHPEDMFRQVKGEGLNVGCVLTWGPCYRYQRQFFSERPHNVSEPKTLLKYDLEISGFGSQAMGHVCLLNLKDQTYPGSEGTETQGWPRWTTPVLRWARAQGGVTGYAHSASGLAIEPLAAARRLLVRWDANSDERLDSTEVQNALLPEPFARLDRDQDGTLIETELVESLHRAADRLPNLAIPEMNGVGAMEICVSTAEGVCDFISAMDTRRIQEWNTWYHLLNCGFPLKVSGETDFPCMSSRRVGQGRVYVRLGGVPGMEATPLDFERWCKALAQGRSYISDGFAHALEFRVNDVRPGEGAVELAEPGPVIVTADVTFAPETPETVAQGIVVPHAGQHLVGDTVELHGPRTDRRVTGGTRLVEIVVNGQPLGAKRIPADGQIHRLRFEIPVSRSSWIALRQFPQLHTNPVNVFVANAPIRASRDSARWCDEVVALLWKNRQHTLPEAEREDARQTFERAQQRFRQIAAESP